MNDILQRAMQRLPGVHEWIQNTLRRHKETAQPISTLGFQRLPRFFEPALLDEARFVAVEQVPMTALGLPEFAALEDMSPIAITYDRTYFVRASCVETESLHFHELIHVLQWKRLGFRKFTIAYATGLVLCGYEGHPLESQTRRHEERFNNFADSYDVAQQVHDELPGIVSRLNPGVF